MSYYRICTNCGAHLDAGEVCDCQNKEEAAPVLQHRDGKAEKGLRSSNSASTITENGGFVK